jgi:formimidoylglutamate deiminase
MRVIEPEAAWLASDPVSGAPGPVLASKVRITIDSGRIVGLEPADRHSFLARKLPGRVVLPGLVDAHSHAFQRAFRGHVQWRAQSTDDFWIWRDAMYRVANGLSPEGVEAVSALAFLELALAGVTHVGEFHYLHHAPDGTRYSDPDELARRVIAAAANVGVRITLLRVAYGRHSFGNTLRPEQRRFGDSGPEEALAAVERLRRTVSPRVTIGLAPHSVRAVPRDWLAAYRDFDGVIHAHISEQPAENTACLAEYGCSPLQVFAEAGLLHERFTAVHLTFPEPGDVEAIRAEGASICVCPSTELDLGDGFLPLAAREGTRLCLGSDSHVVADPLGEARALEWHARALAGRRNILSPVGERHGLARRLLEVASAGGARSLGQLHAGLAVGSPADLFAVDVRRPQALGVPMLEAAVFSSTPEWVSDVWVDGEAIIEDGVHPKAESILAAARPHLTQVLV